MSQLEDLKAFSGPHLLFLFPFFFVVLNFNYVWSLSPWEGESLRQLDCTQNYLETVPSK